MSNNTKTTLENVIQPGLARHSQIEHHLRKWENKTPRVSAGKPLDGRTITSIPPEGLLIDEPGEYQLVNDIEWSPAQKDAVALLIVSNDVTLDFNGHQLACAAPLIASVGVLCVGTTNVTIRNGQIRDMGLIGLKVLGAKNVNVEKINVIGLGPGRELPPDSMFGLPLGISFTFCEDVTCAKSTVEKIDLPASFMLGISFFETNGTLLRNCAVNNLHCDGGGCIGVSHWFSTKAQVVDCAASRVRTSRNSRFKNFGYTCAGFWNLNTHTMEMSGCLIDDIKGCCDDAHGITTYPGRHMTLRDCRVSNVVDGDTPGRTGAKATGIETYGRHIELIDCVVEFITAIRPQDTQAAGFSCVTGPLQTEGDIDDPWIQFTRCRAYNVNVVDQYLAPTLNVSLEIGSEKVSSFAFGAGFAGLPDPRAAYSAFVSQNIAYTDCKAEGCQVGFDSWNHKNSTWDRIESKCNAISVLNFPFLVRTVSCNQCSECPHPTITPLVNQASGNRFQNVTADYCDLNFIPKTNAEAV